jgi:GT2 family glycosyltransferase
MSKLTVALINWDAVEMTERCLACLNEHTDRSAVTIYVVDNGSADPENVRRLQELQRRNCFDHLIALPSNVGFPRAFNLLVERTEGELFCYVSNDCLVEAGWLDAAVEAIRSDDRVAVVCSNVYLQERHRQPAEDMEIDYLYGAIMLLRRSAWDTIGKFDDKNFSPGYGEEMDWAYRAMRSGYRIKLAGKSLARHLESYTTKKNYGRDEARLLRLTHRMKYRLFNWSLSQLLLTSWKTYAGEIYGEVKNGTLHLMLLAAINNLLILPTIWHERRKRLSKVKRYWPASQE